MSETLLSACLIVRDEERCIGACIASLRGLVDEVVVVDTGSSDATPQLAQRLGARVFHHPWKDDFSLHRNQSIDHAEGDWCFIVDADEVVEPGDFEETRARLGGAGLPNVLMVKHWSSYPGGDRVLEYQPRLLRKSSGIRYVHPIHEQLAVTGEEALLSNLVMAHDGYEDDERLYHKHERNLAIAERMPDDEPHAWHCRMRSLSALGRWVEAQEAAARLLALPELPEPLQVDAHILIAAAMVDPRRAWEPLPEFKQHIEAARALDPASPDIPFLEMYAAALWYLRALDEANHPNGPDFLRIGAFWRAGTKVGRLVEALIGGGPEALHRTGQVARGC